MFFQQSFFLYHSQIFGRFKENAVFTKFNLCSALNHNQVLLRMQYFKCSLSKEERWQISSLQQSFRLKHIHMLYILNSPSCYDLVNYIDFLGKCHNTRTLCQLHQCFTEKQWKLLFLTTISYLPNSTCLTTFITSLYEMIKSHTYR